jgi:2-polyprenyl-3-methyl-5-hydroxy-6-metoxy-1,4-benzoquinol methylase
MTVCNYSRIDHEERPQAKRVAEWFRRVGLKEAYDIGCGPGTYVRELEAAGINTIGFDPDQRAPDYGVRVIARDFTIANNAPPPRKSVLCLEVAEHIDQSLALTFVHNVANSLVDGGILVWSAAIPGQGGEGHINCQYKPYWLQRLRRFGLMHCEHLSEQFLAHMRAGPHMGWITQNAMVLVKSILLERA